ncbi:solute carrier family 2, facilitated glucose transporter member 3-like isoform X2 [Chrysoperla carnea]|uniref:solute carrier family 2, facilitated glucose transporter member 3-like isoform X2 n=1 Tax=Chrysoperla carnea TaxID=189513 RepID=UPI001D08CE9F|nr:solute carrier family 2, facilitated glucose transporter member 3-like isoform X2 [Chrysoperla carnea]
MANYNTQQEKVMLKDRTASSLNLNQEYPTAKWSFVLLLSGFSTMVGLAMSCGWGIGVMNAPADIIKQFCNDSIYQQYDVTLSEGGLNFLWSCIVSIFIVGGVTGSLSGACIANRVGRKGALVCAYILALLAATGFMFSKSFQSVELLLLGRLLLGISGGLTTSVMPMYLTELATIQQRGAMGVLCPLGLTTGLLISQILGLDFILGLPTTWHYLISFYAVLLVIGLAALPFLPESPKYLFVIRDEPQYAIQELTKLRGVPAHELAEEIELLKTSKHLAEQCDSEWTIATVLKDRSLLLPILLVCALQGGQQCSGINAVFYYSVSVFKSAGLNPQQAAYANIGAGIMNFAISFIVIPIMSCTGRRTLALFSCITAAICLIILSFSITYITFTPWMPFVCIIALLSYVFFYGFGLGPIPYFIGSELFDVGPRPAAMALGSMCNWAGNFLVGLFFPLLSSFIGAYSFLIFAGVCVLLFLFLRVYLPETKGRDVTEIAQICSHGLSRQTKK